MADAEFVADVPGGLADEAADDVVFPHATFGNVEFRPDDTDGIDGAIVQLGLEIHDRPTERSGSRVTVLGICELIRAVLHRADASLDVGDLHVWRIEVQTLLAERKADGKTYLGRVALQVSIHE